MRNRLPMVFSFTALLVALFGITPLGEAAYNAVVPRNSVGTLQLQRNAVKSAKIAPNAIRTGHVLDGSLLTADFKAGQIPQGPEGRQGRRRKRGPARSQRLRDRDRAFDDQQHHLLRERFLPRREEGVRGRRHEQHLVARGRSLRSLQQSQRRRDRMERSDGLAQRRCNRHGNGLRRLRHCVLRPGT